MAIDTSGMITVAEAAKRLELSQEQVRRNLRDGKLRGQRIGNQWFVEEQQIAHLSGDGLIPQGLWSEIHILQSEIAPRLRDIDISEEIRRHRDED